MPVTPAPKRADRFEDPAAYMPLTPLACHILLAGGDRPLHGYAIIQDIEQRTNGAMHLRSGTLYTAIHRLETDRLIRRTEKRPDDERDDERRRYYEVTPLGQRVARLESGRLAAMLSTARSRDLYHQPEPGE